jgi:hypothetical protein
MDHVLLLSERPASGGSDLPIILTAIGAIAGPFIAAFAIAVEGRRIRRQLGFDNMWQLVKQWDDSSFRARRSAAAKDLLDNFERGRKHLNREAIDVLDFLELLAYLVRSGSFRLEDAWVNFSSAAIRWWQVCQPGIESWREEEDATIYQEFSDLVDQLMRREFELTGIDQRIEQPPEEELKSFLQDEIDLTRTTSIR